MGIKVEKPSLLKTIKTVKSMSNSQGHSDIVTRKLAEQTKQEIEQAHDGVMAIDKAIDGKGFTSPVNKYSDVSVSVEKTKKGHKVVASGEKWLFYEFGAGVHFNTPRNWSNKLNINVPSGIVPIGTHGSGQGKNQFWQYDDEDTQQRIITQGYGAVHGIANAFNKNVDSIDKFVKEAFNEQQ